MPTLVHTRLVIDDPVRAVVFHPDAVDDSALYLIVDEARKGEFRVPFPFQYPATTAVREDAEEEHEA